MSSCSCSCKGGNTLIFACSGGSDVGEITDKTARKLGSQGKGKMFCLAGIGGRIEPIMNATKQAENLVAIDGCPLNCTKQSLELAGITEFKHVNLQDAGLVKGSTPVTEENIDKAVAACGL